MSKIVPKNVHDKIKWFVQNVGKYVLLKWLMILSNSIFFTLLSQNLTDILQAALSEFRFKFCDKRDFLKNINFGFGTPDLFDVHLLKTLTTQSCYIIQCLEI